MHQDYRQPFNLEHSMNLTQVCEKAVVKVVYEYQKKIREIMTPKGRFISLLD